jgi:hypothetical protein
MDANECWSDAVGREENERAAIFTDIVTLGHIGLNLASPDWQKSVLGFCNTALRCAS